MALAATGWRGDLHHQRTIGTPLAATSFQGPAAVSVFPAKLRRPGLPFLRNAPGLQVVLLGLGVPLPGRLNDRGVDHLACCAVLDPPTPACVGEQLELLWCGSASHRHLPESHLGTPMARSNLASVVLHSERRPRCAAMQSEVQEQRPRRPAQPLPASIGWRPDRTSRQGSQADDRTRHRSGYSETPSSRPSRSPRERELVGRPKDAKGGAPRAHRSRGRSVIQLYNGTRPHSSLGGRTPDKAYLNQPTPIPAAA